MAQPEHIINQKIAAFKSSLTKKELSDFANYTLSEHVAELLALLRMDLKPMPMEEFLDRVFQHIIPRQNRTTLLDGIVLPTDENCESYRKSSHLMEIRKRLGYPSADDSSRPRKEIRSPSTGDIHQGVYIDETESKLLYLQEMFHLIFKTGPLAEPKPKTKKTKAKGKVEAGAGLERKSSDKKATPRESVLQTEAQTCKESPSVTQKKAKRRKRRRRSDKTELPEAEKKLRPSKLKRKTKKSKLSAAKTKQESPKIQRETAKPKPATEKSQSPAVKVKKQHAGQTKAQEPEEITVNKANLIPIDINRKPWIPAMKSGIETIKEKKEKVKVVLPKKRTKSLKTPAKVATQTYVTDTQLQSDSVSPKTEEQKGADTQLDDKTSKKFDGSTKLHRKVGQLYYKDIELWKERFYYPVIHQSKVTPSQDKEKQLLDEKPQLQKEEAKGELGVAIIKPIQDCLKSCFTIVRSPFRRMKALGKKLKLCTATKIKNIFKRNVFSKKEKSAARQKKLEATERQVRDPDTKPKTLKSCIPSRAIVKVKECKNWAKRLKSFAAAKIKKVFRLSFLVRSLKTKDTENGPANKKQKSKCLKSPFFTINLGIKKFKSQQKKLKSLAHTLINYAQKHNLFRGKTEPAVTESKPEGTERAEQLDICAQMKQGIEKRAKQSQFGAEHTSPSVADSIKPPVSSESSEEEKSKQSFTVERKRETPPQTPILHKEQELRTAVEWSVSDLVSHVVSKSTLTETDFDMTQLVEKIWETVECENIKLDCEDILTDLYKRVYKDLIKMWEKPDYIVILMEIDPQNVNTIAAAIYKKYLTKPRKLNVVKRFFNFFLCCSSESS